MINKMLKNWHCKNTGLLLIRLGVGAIFLVHGAGKLANISGTTGFFESLGIPMAFLMAWIVALVETLAGLGMILGVFTKIGGLLLAFTMLVAIITAKFPNGGLMAAELEIMLLLASLGISFIGPGKYSLGNHHCGCVGGKCGCSGSESKNSHGAICAHGCSHGDGNCDNCKDCKNNCADCENCKDENCSCGVCKNKCESCGGIHKDEKGICVNCNK